MTGFWTSLLVVFLSLSSFAGAATEKVLYSFGTNASDGMTPNGGLIFDKAGNLYGTTGYMPNSQCPDCGIVFELSPTSNGPWTETILYQFCSLANCADGQSPRAGLIFDASGNLYGTTQYGGTNGDYGTVFELSPPSAPGGKWTETVLWAFDYTDGSEPSAKLTWDASGNLYGTTEGGGGGIGTVFELSPGSPSWTHKLLYTFCTHYPDCSDGAVPMAGVTFDSAGNLYGTTSEGGTFGGGKWGVVYELAPASEGDWTETTIHLFSSNSGGDPLSEVFFDNAGNLYGTVSQGGPYSPAQCGGVFRLTPVAGNWKAATFPFNDSGADGCLPLAGVFVDGAANTVFGTTETGPFPYGGTVFKITGTQETILYTFCQLDHCADGDQANSFLTPRNGKLYGTTLEGGTSSACGQFGCGVVYEITP
jgi:uncharacterized repeat protein (TIGR03803 family)